MNWNGAWRAAKSVLIGMALAVALFPVLGWIGSTIPRGSGTGGPGADGVTIMVETNGTHTGIVMPVVTPGRDWRTTFPTAGRPRPDGQIPTHIAVGWGEREIFMEVETWGDLNPLTALRIATLGGDAVMRVSHYVRPAPSDIHRPVTLARDDYLAMARAIEASLSEPGPDGTRTILRGTAPADAYYAARGHYTLANSCNSWVGDMLAIGGLPMGWWTPFAGGVMKWIEPPARSAKAATSRPS